MPSESLWIQYSVVGILILASGAIAAAFFKLWRDLLGWLTGQDTNRQVERDKQRTWEAEQSITRDTRWHGFLRIMQEEIAKNDTDHAQALKELSAKIDVLIITVNQHDTWTRAQK